MFFQPPEKESSNSIKSSQKNTRRKRKKKLSQKNKKQAIRKGKFSHFEVSMSSWAENFTMAATWQLKHQVAHWKSKVKALEYENMILRDMLRQSFVNGGIAEGSCGSRSERGSIRAEEMCSNSEMEEEYEDGDDIVPSEEFIEYLRQNREFRQAREERIRKANEESKQLERELEQGPEPPENKMEILKELYGGDWQKIAALEAALQSQFISDCDNDKPSYWPNIPLRI